MPDNPKIRGPEDGKRISLKEEHEVRYWTQTLGVSRDDLERAVKEVGHGVEQVRAFLKPS